MTTTASEPATDYSSPNDTPRVVVAHDYLTQRGGAERVALALAQELRPDAFVTSVYNPTRTFDGFEPAKPTVSFLQSLAIARRDPRIMLPLLPFAWSGRKPLDADIVVCSSSGWSHALPLRAGATKIVYCHNPARWLYQPEDYLDGQSTIARIALMLLRPALKRWDRRAARSADVYIANSTSVARRIKQAYNIDAEVIFPPLSMATHGNLRRPEGLHVNDFFVTVGRSRGYKNTEVLVDAFRQMPQHHLVVVGETVGDLPPNVTVLFGLSDGELGWLYKNARALMSVSREDFGLTPIEANSHGTPALVLRAGGFLDSTIEGTTGSFIESATPEAVVQAVETFRRDWDEFAIKRSTEAYHQSTFVQRVLAAGARENYVPAPHASIHAPCRDQHRKTVPYADNARNSVSEDA